MTVKQTLDIFTNAAGVVGYHGAGHANTLFTANPSCVIEISTYRTLDWKPWRSNSELATQNDLLFWHTVRIKLQTLLSANAYAGELPGIARDLAGHEGRKLAVARSKWIKNLRHVRLVRCWTSSLEGRTTRQLRPIGRGADDRVFPAVTTCVSVSEAAGCREACNRNESSRKELDI
jgi:hypothetical protein